MTVAVTVYAVHHGLTKAALFIALDAPGKAGRRGLISIMLLLALSLMLAGLPFTSGAVAKALAKEAVGELACWVFAPLLDALETKGKNAAPKPSLEVIYDDA